MMLKFFFNIATVRHGGGLTKCRLSFTSRDGAGKLGWVCRRRWKGLGLGEEAEVNLAKEKDRGRFQELYPSLAPCWPGGKAGVSLLAQVCWLSRGCL